MHVKCDMYGVYTNGLDLFRNVPFTDMYAVQTRLLQSIRHGLKPLSNMQMSKQVWGMFHIAVSFTTHNSESIYLTYLNKYCAILIFKYINKC